MQSNKQASPLGISGRESRRARNVVRRWYKYSLAEQQDTDRRQRYERACALILADKLRNS